MDRKSLIILLVSFILLTLWYPITNRLFPPIPKPPGQVLTNAEAPSALGTTSNRSTTVPDTAAVPAPTRPATGPEQTLTIENQDVRYIFTSRLGGLKTVELKEYPATIECRNRNAASSKQLATLNSTAPTPILAIYGDERIEGDGVFTLTNAAGVVRAEKTLTNGLHIIKEFRPSTNYLLKTTVRFENRSNQPLALPAQEWVVGTATPIDRSGRELAHGNGLVQRLGRAAH